MSSLKLLVRVTIILTGWGAWMGHGCTFCQGALDDLDLEVMVPPGGVLDNGGSADLPVQSGDCFVTRQSPTSMFAALVDDEANMTWAEQTPFRAST